MIAQSPGEGLPDTKQLSDFDPSTIIEHILPRGHSFHGYSSVAGERVIKILATTSYSDDSPLLGFGVDGDAEMALGRAIASYLQREQDGLEHMSARQYPHLTEGDHPGSGHASKFDNIVWSGDFTLYQDGSDVVAYSSYGGEWALEPLEVRGRTAHEAISLLTERYRPISSFKSIRDRLSALPSLAWGQVNTDPATFEIEQ